FHSISPAARRSPLFPYTTLFRSHRRERRRRGLPGDHGPGRRGELPDPGDELGPGAGGLRRGRHPRAGVAPERAPRGDLHAGRGGLGRDHRLLAALTRTPDPAAPPAPAIEAPAPA